MLFILFIVVLIALAYLAVVVRAVERRRLHTTMRGIGYDALDELGISVLAVDGLVEGQLEALLSVEYPRYEVVIALAGDRPESTLTRCIEQYRLIKVEYHPTGELPVQGVRALYRSRKRRFRRLVVLDLKVDVPRVLRLNAAADVATYEYLLPVACGAKLASGAIELLISELDTLREESFEQVRTIVGRRATLYVRSSVVAAGGFGSLSHRLMGRKLATPIFESPRRRISPWRILGWGAALLLCFVLVGVLLRLVWWVIVAVVVTGLLLLLIGVRLKQLARF